MVTGVVDWEPTRDAPTGGRGRGMRNDLISFMCERVAVGGTGRQAGMSGGLSVGWQDFLRELASDPLTLAHYVVVQRSHDD